jgi:amidase
MNDTVDLMAAGPILADMVAAIVENAASLSELDGKTGDGDHGVNMSKGFRITGRKIAASPCGLGEGFGVLAETLLDEIGGSMGPLYGSFFLDMSTSLRGCTVLDRETFGAMLHKGIDAVVDLGEAKPGDKSLVDVLVPASAAFDSAARDGQDFSACLDALRQAADAGFEATRDMVARIGRASRLGERSRGSHDAGAASCRLLLNTLAAGLQARLAGASGPGDPRKSGGGEAPGLLDTLQAVADGTLAAQDAIDARWARARARALEPDLQAFAFLPDATPCAGNGPLAGLAVGIKDLIDTADMPTAYGSAPHVGHRPPADAAVVVRLRGLGATVLGKTVTTEFAYRQPGPTRNPWNLGHTPGGSSSGSAAAVAAGIVPLALGTQTMGSVIRPAAFCGIVGVKPTFGTLSRAGVHPLCGALDHVGLFARSVPDAAAALAHLAGWPKAAGGVTTRPLRFGALAMTDDTIQASQRQATEAAWGRIAAAGHAVEPLAVPLDPGEVDALVETLLAFEAVLHFGALVERHGTAIGPAIRALVDRGRAIGEADYTRAIARQTDLRRAVADAVAGVDAILTIPAAGEAPRGIDHTGDPRFCAPWSLLGVPAVTVPIGLGPAGLPLGLQLVGPWGGDQALLSAAAGVAGLFPRLGVPPLQR